MDWTPQGCISPQSRRSRGPPKPNATPSGGAKSYDCIPGSISRPVARGGACLDNSDPRLDRETAATGKPLGCSFQSGCPWTFSPPLSINASSDFISECHRTGSRSTSTHEGFGPHANSEGFDFPASRVGRSRRGHLLDFRTQSQALTALVGQITQSQQDPMMDLSSASSSSSTRATLGRAIKRSWRPTPVCPEVNIPTHATDSLRQCHSGRAVEVGREGASPRQTALLPVDKDC